jgi:hypothetical protein
MPGTDTDWYERAACRQRLDLDWFDLDCDLQSCVEVCVTCQAADDCLNYAITNDLREGVWGGEWGYRLGWYIDQGRGTHDQG